MEHSRMKLVRIVLTPFSFGSLLPLGRTRESNMAATLKHKNTAKADAKQVDVRSVYRDTMKRYPKTMALLAE
jgi:hypothetical protein